MFVASLTNLCETVLKAEEKEKTLIDGLDALNAELPAKVYLPFVKGSVRNYYVLHVRVGEAKVFVTKNRAPFLCVFELYRPDEVKFKNVGSSRRQINVDDLESGP